MARWSRLCPRKPSCSVLRPSTLSLEESLFHSSSEYQRNLSNFAPYRPVSEGRIKACVQAQDIQLELIANASQAQSKISDECYSFLMFEKTIWHNSMDWVIRRDWEGYSYRAIHLDKWLHGVPPGMTVLDAALIFDSVLRPTAAA